MRKKLTISIFVAAFAWLAFAGAAMAKQDIPEVNGTYDVPGRPNLKVRVFVHGPKINFGKKALPQTACSDADSNSVVRSAGWRLPAGTWSYYVNSANAPSLNGASFGAIADASFAEWSSKTEVRNAITAFQNAGTTETSRYALDGKNILTWGKAPSNALAVTYIWYNRKTKVAVETDTIMNKSFLWSWTSYSSGICGVSGTYDAQNILTHELGHWVGLDDHYTANYANNTMYGYGAKGEIKKDTLTQGDIAGVAKIY